MGDGVAVVSRYCDDRSKRREAEADDIMQRVWKTDQSLEKRAKAKGKLVRFRKKA
jgi:hypothetical protein